MWWAGSVNERTQIRSHGRWQVGALAVVAGLGPLGYPLMLAARTRGIADPSPLVVAEWPSLSVIVPAYREAAVIAAKVASVMATGYAGPLEVIVVAEDADTAVAAAPTGATVLWNGTRSGKPDALNRGVAAARHEALVFTDANAMLEPGALTALGRWLGDRDVAGVAGEKVAGSGGEGMYWRYESWLKRQESRLGGTVFIDGGLAAVRRTAWRPLPQNVVVDDLWIALDVVQGGGRIVYEPEAVVIEDEYLSLRALWERRTRIVAGTFELLRQRRGLLGRWDDVTVQLWGHKLLRQSVGPVAHAVLLLMTAAPVCGRRPRVERWLLVGHAAAVAAFCGQRAGLPVPGPAAAPGQFLFLQAAALGGVFRWLRGDLSSLWAKDERAYPVTVE